VLIGVPPAWRDTISTTAGRSFDSVRLLPMNRTRPATGARVAGALVCDGAPGDDLQLGMAAAATMSTNTAFLTPHPGVIGAKVSTTKFHTGA